MPDGVPQRVAVDEEFGQFFVELLDRVGGIEAKGDLGGLGTIAVAVPDFSLFVLLTAEEDGFRLLPPISTTTASGSGKPVRYQK